MKKVIIISILAILLTSCGIKNDNNTVNKIEDKPQIHTILKPKTSEEKYWVLAKFIKKDLSLQEDKDLQEILKERKQKISEIRKMLLKRKIWCLFFF